MTTDPNLYYQEGCGRCPLFQTPECKVHPWADVLIRLRETLLSSGLKEEAKWGVPCFTHEGRNILLLAALKDACTLSFMRGGVLPDPEGRLEWAGPNSHHAKLLRIKSLEEAEAAHDLILGYISASIEAEELGIKTGDSGREREEMPDELAEALQADPQLAEAFFSLTPGRQRGYLIFFSGAKSSKARSSRIEKMIPQILAGKGMHDDMRARAKKPTGV